MKKIAIGLFLLIAVAVASWYMLQPGQLLHPSFQPSDLLPEQTLFTLEMVDVQKNIQDFRNSRLGKNLAEIDFPSVLRELGTAPDDIAAFEETKNTLLSNLDSPLFNELFGREMVVALLPFEKPLPASPPPEYILNSMLIISRPRHNTNLLSLAAQWFKKDLAIREETYHQHTITLVELEHDTPIYYAALNDLLMISVDIEQIKRSLELSEGIQIGLSNNASYQNLREQVRSSETAVFSYANLSGFMENIVAASQATDLQSPAQNALQENFTSNLKGIHAIGSAFDINSSLRHSSKMLCLVNPDNMNPFFRHTFSIQPDHNQTLSMIPSDPLMYYWANTIDAKAYMNHCFRDPVQRRQLENDIREQLNIEPEHLMEALGNQWAMVLEDVSMDGFFPIPKLALLAQAVDREMVSRLLQKVFQRPEIRYSQETFKGITIHSAQLPLGMALQPAYAFLNGFCILASHPDMIKQMMAADANGTHIAQSERFQNLDKGLTNENNNIAFIQSDKLIEKLQSVVEWGSNMSAMQGGGMSRNNQVMLEEIIHPILDGLKMYKTIGMRTRSGKDTIETIGIYELDDEPHP